MRFTLAFVALTALVAPACGDDGGGPDGGSGDGGRMDGGPRPDAPGPDSGPFDAAYDAALPDTCEEPALYVAPGGDDGAAGTESAPLASVQAALDRATPGTTVCLREGSYAERVTISAGGAADAWLTLRSYPGEHATLTGEGAGMGTERNMVYLEAVSYVRVAGLELLGAGTVSDASGIRVYGSADHIELLGNEIHEIRGSDAMGITIYGADGPGITDLVIDGNDIHDCEPAESETLTVNGNVRRFRITNNRITDVNNIGIDVIGGESWLSAAFPDDGLIAGNTVTRANSSYDGSAACIYSDGASNLIIERNRVTGCDFGIEVGAENPGVVTRSVIVRSNFVYDNYQGGIIFGGYGRGRGRVQEAVFVHNTLYENGRPGERTPQGFDGADNGEIIIQWADDCVIKDNIAVGLPDTGELVQHWGTDTGMVFGSNLFFNEGAAGDWPMGAGSMFADPMLADPAAGDLHLRDGSPALGAAEAVAEAGEQDIDGEARVQGMPDIGADERP